MSPSVHALSSLTVEFMITFTGWSDCSVHYSVIFSLSVIVYGTIRSVNTLVHVSATFDHGLPKYLLGCVWTFPPDTAVCTETVGQWAQLVHGYPSTLAVPHADSAPCWSVLHQVETVGSQHCCAFFCWYEYCSVYVSSFLFLIMDIMPVFLAVAVATWSWHSFASAAVFVT